MKNVQRLAMLLIFLTPIFSNAATPLIATCSDSAEGVSWSANLDSSVPTLTSTIKAASQPTPSVTTYISTNSVCGVSANFAAVCKSRVRTFQGDYSFEFNCTNGISGEVYTNGNSLNLSCSGPSVTSGYQNGFFDNCTITRPSFN